MDRHPQYWRFGIGGCCFHGELMQKIGKTTNIPGPLQGKLQAF